MAGSQTVSAPRTAATSQLSRPRLGWLALLAILLLAWLPLLGAQYRELADPPASARTALHDAAVSATGHAVYHTALDIAFGGAAIAVAGIVLFRREPGSIGTRAALTLAVWGPLNGLAVEAALAGPRLAIGLVLGAWTTLALLCWWAVRQYPYEPELRRRLQVRWLVYGAAVSAVLMAALFGGMGSPLWLDADQVDRLMTVHLLEAIAGLPFLASVWVAWVSPTVRDPDTLIRRTMVYGAMTGVVVGGTVGLVLLPAMLYYELGPVYLIFVVCAWSILGLRLQEAVQRTVNRMLYGQRGEPEAVLSDLGSRLELGSPETVLSAIVETVATALKLPGVAIRSGDGATLASTGELILEPVAVPILHQGELQGELIVSPRARDEALDGRDNEVLRLVARQAGPTVRAVQLTQELRRSRQEILTSREEERRRIRRDLHDGLGPALAAIAMQVDTARAIVDDDPMAARELLEAVTAQAEDVVGDVRRLVYDLRPPALDQLGLIGAVERLARQASSTSLAVDVMAGAGLPRLNAATEVALYRIVAEALTNAARHSGASACTVRLEATNGEMVAAIEDNGVGIGPDVIGGIGLKSMQDRAAEVGGELTIEPRAGGGTRVTGRFPLSATEVPND